MKTLLPRYIPELDGLRAIAILLVLLFHLNVPGFSLGWSGVNLFFVISGFLITGILLDSKEKPHYFKNFYIRRTLRIFPIYYMSLAVVTFYAILLGGKITDLPYYVIYLQNYLLGMKNWGPSFPIAFNHTWSLALEEQFYLLWPLFVRILDRRKLFYCILSFFVISLGSRAFFMFATQNPNLVFTPLTTQLDGLGAGALLALLVRYEQVRIPDLIYRSKIILLLSAIGLAVVIFSTGPSAYWNPVNYFTQLKNLVLYSFLGVFFASIVSLAIFNGGLLARFLQNKGLMFIGKISYGIYLYHFPIFILMPKLAQYFGVEIFAEKSWVADLIKLALTFIIAIISWNLIELPFLSLKERLTASTGIGSSRMISSEPAD